MAASAICDASGSGAGLGVGAAGGAVAPACAAAAAVGAGCAVGAMVGGALVGGGAAVAGGCGAGACAAGCAAVGEQAATMPPKPVSRASRSAWRRLILVVIIPSPIDHPGATWASRANEVDREFPLFVAAALSVGHSIDHHAENTLRGRNFRL